MKTVILCGGRGTRLNRQGALIPKALFRIGDDPLILHLCRIYKHFGLNKFELCLGFLAEEFGRFFGQSILQPAQLVETISGKIAESEGIGVHLIETGVDTNTGGRVKMLEERLRGEQTFCVTYGDGLADIDIRRLLEFHRSHGKIATLTAVNPMSNFGLIDLNDDNSVARFREKPKLKEWINGGFFVFNREIFDYLEEDSVLEREPFERLAAEGHLMAYRHGGFWKCMDTFKDNVELNDIWNSGAPWKVW